ncbi:Nn.00g028700.m01.CDS01 [Neocucurbitaria sp. VM-36]
MGGVPSVPHDRTRTLRVIGAGYSRTGTVSMAMALEKLLDGPVMHGGSQLLGREDAYVKLWSRILSERHNRPVLLKLLREATAGFVAITDAPGNCFVEELLELYPDAQVVCVRRNRETWWKSWEAVTKTADAGYLNWFLAVVPGKRWFPTLVLQFLEQQEEQFGPMTANRMDEHNEYVKRVTPREKFHMMELSDGWEPLCKMLGTSVPEEPFPRANDAAAVDGLAKAILFEATWRWATVFGFLGLAAYSIARLR